MPTALLDEILHALLGAPDDAAVEAAVDSGASAMAAHDDRWPDVSRAYVALGSRVVAGCWARGWQPADVVRMVARGLGERHVRLGIDIVAAAAREESAARRGSRWAAQLRALEAEAWWSGDDEYLTRFARRENLMRFEAAGYALEVLRLYARLPAILPLRLEAAEAAHTAPARTPGAEPRMLGRIRALLAKAESTDFAEEAEALSAKAQQLMARHSIDAALLAASGGESAPGETPGAIRIGVDTPYDAEKAMLLDAVAEANRCRTVWSREFGFSTVIGFAADLDAVELLYTSLLVQATAAMTRDESRSRRRNTRGARNRDYRQSFLVAYADRIGERLTTAVEQAAHEAASGDAPADLLPVLASRTVAVHDATDRMFPDLVTHRVRIRDEEGWTHGQAAADRADVGPRGIGRGRGPAT
ncbi:DUF2786 domain-containing protein [Yinghuangia sp. ASG 101]|uniref:DUF2786 domain-containing protein n=1 Tax=Yinghuangia sp. ASG 101 TaxID=2896848 RepID=UPI001E3E18B6|nr:DUF2786 domain-containing protein [Yinghuangia sp. ASG 101]UGQ09228.1 DUF2786 domain-containing protein [Yinghuangia sp. ASG 101]